MLIMEIYKCPLPTLFGGVEQCFLEDIIQTFWSHIHILVDIEQTFLVDLGQIFLVDLNVPSGVQTNIVVYFECQFLVNLEKRFQWAGNIYFFLDMEHILRSSNNICLSGHGKITSVELEILDL